MVILLISLILAIGASYYLKQQVTDTALCVFKNMMWAICSTSLFGGLIISILGAESFESFGLMIMIMTVVCFYSNRTVYKAEQKYAIHNQR